MTYTALYREWRPRTFTEVVGQEHIVRTLVNALRGGRLSHAYLFCGPRGTGKTSIAKILARAANCRQPEEGNPCGRCHPCRDIEAGTSMDVTEIDAASNRGIDEVRDLREKIKFAPSGGRFRVFIIDEVHMLTNEAFNALLKTLEEPPGHAMFILATTEPHRVPLTILSRCQRFDFHRIGEREMTGRIRAVAKGSGIEIDQAAVDLIVRASEGGMRDALGILDQAAAYGANRVGVDEIHSILGTVREDLLKSVVSGLVEGRAGEVLEIIGNISDRGKDLRIFLKDLNSYIRGLMLDKLNTAEPGDREIDRLSRVIAGLARADQDMRWSSQPRILLEVALVRAARTLADGESSAGNEQLGELVARVREVEALMAKMAGRVRDAQPEKTEEDPIDYRPAGSAGRFFGPVTAGGAAGESHGTRQEARAAETVRDRGRPARVTKAPAAAAVPAKLVDPAPDVQPAAQKNIAAKNDNIVTNKNSPPAGEVLKKIESRWNDILETARKVYPNIATHLTQGKGWPLEVEGNTLTVAFPRSEPYTPLAVRILESEINRKELSELIKSVCREDLRVRLVEADGKPPRKAGPPKKTVRPDDVEALFGEGEEVSGEDFQFDS
ncbi:MAG: DNA polymerase III subunit gamma/tau [Bacillota bacterium]